MFILRRGFKLNIRVLKKVALACFFLLLLVSYSKAQLIINEISQGPSGSKEYVELLVVGTPSCSSIPCLDLRGYYIDDNNGSQATGSGTGIAQGCIRFKNTSFWSCIPIGTLIVIYNDADINSSIPSQDLSMTDGNCRLIIPVSNCTLLETNIDFPSLTSAAFPTSGFTSCGDWATLAMANGDDSFQTVDPSGNPVFSVSWGNNTANPIIYFAGTSSSTVAYMANTVDDNPNNQGNWERVAIGSNETPGFPNNAANAAWISSMNNSCTPLTPLVLTTSSTNPGCFCDGEITVTATGGNAPYSYSWAPSGGNSSTATGLCAGTYTVTVTTANGCSETATVTLVANSTLTVTTNDVTICTGQNATLTASGANDYAWSNGSANNSITESPGTTTTYTVTGTSGTCTGTATGTITVGSALSVTVNSETICTGQSTTLTATGADDYVWSDGSINNSITKSPAATTSYTVTGTSNGCTGTTTGTITVGSALSVTVNSETICTGQSTTLTAMGADDYVWSDGSTNNSITDSPISTTSYTVTGTSNGCTGTATGTITVGSALSVTVNSETICTGQSATLTATGADDYVWSDGSTNNSITDSPISTTSYTVTGTSNGCTGTAIANIEVKPSPDVLFNADLLSGCEPFCSNFTDMSTTTGSNIIAWNWDFGDGNASDVQHPQYCFNNQGKYSITLTVTSGNGCTSSVTNTDMIILDSRPVADFILPDVRSIFESTVSFTDNSTGAANWNWDFGDVSDSLNNASSLTNPAHTYSEPGTYCVTLAIANNAGCKDTNQQCFEINSQYTFYIPNAFSPNGDGKNDEFFGKGEGILEFEITIYDRWGNIVFVSKDINEHWNGKSQKGNSSQQDSYVYNVVIKDTKKERHQYSGNIIIAR